MASLSTDVRCHSQPIGYAEADFANQISNRRSTTGRKVMLYGSAIVWSSRQQKTVALSTTEAVYYSLEDLGRDIVWVRQLMSDLGSPITDPTPAREYSRSAIKWATESASWAKTRHIAVQLIKHTRFVSG